MAGNFGEVSPWFSTGTISTNYTSNPFRVSEFDRFAIQFNCSGTLVGRIGLIASIDGLNFVDVPDSVFSVSSPNVYLVSVTEFAYKYIAAVFTRTSGAGEIEAKINQINFQR